MLGLFYVTIVKENSSVSLTNQSVITFLSLSSTRNIRCQLVVCQFLYIPVINVTHAGKMSHDEEIFQHSYFHFFQI